MNTIVRFFLMGVFTLMIRSFSFGQSTIEGVWFNDVKEAKVEIYKGGNGKYFGKIIWLKEPLSYGKPKLDINNKNEKLRSRPIVGSNILENFSQDGDIYTGGTIYDPKNGKTYSCKISPKDANTLSIRGFIGVSLIGRTTVWARTTK